MAASKSALYSAGLHVIFLTLQVQSELSVQMEDAVEFSVGETAQISCSYFFSEKPPGVIIQWTASKGDRKRIYNSNITVSFSDELPDFVGRINISWDSEDDRRGETVLTIMDLKVKDEQKFACQVDGMSAGMQEHQTSLKVFESPDSPEIEDAESIFRVDSNERLKVATCKTRNGYPRPKITWYRDRTTLQQSTDVFIQQREIQESSGLFTIESELYYVVTKQDKDALFYCEVTYQLPGETRMMESKHINITVHYPSTKTEMWISHPKRQVKEGDTVEISCRGNGNPPSYFLFSKEDFEMDFEQDGEKLLLKNVTRADSGTYLCDPMDINVILDQHQGKTKLQVHYLDEVVLTAEKGRVMKLGDSQKIACNALSSLSTHTKWFKGGKTIGEEHVLELQNVSYGMAGEYRCQVTVSSLPNLHRSAAIHIITLGPPMITSPDDVIMDTHIGDFLNLTCEALGSPTPTLTWKVNNSQMTGWSNHLEGRTLSALDMKVTSNLTVSCIAINEEGTDEKFYRVRASISSSLPPDNNESGVIIAVIIISILLLAVLGSILYFLYKKGKISCGHSGKKEITKEKGKKDDIVMEMKTDKTEETVLLQGVNGDKKSLDQCDEYMEVEN
ncbi:cell surface glycoprotein MUC18-like isoform X2 [Brienomyrus brachyistius]|uniref:cell surface glycoprotein MUC18-like isoform X2 n=1 Tax=Brienomyrus brachyistius TaxID=42636 RepID=UPI0020B22B8C|nr:cell surface glycoprotein MUC18-like isoform X2 [Brienomyrus brachyistius]